MDEPSKEPDSDFRVKFELSFRRRRAHLLPWFVIGIVLLGVAERLIRVWIET